MAKLTLTRVPAMTGGRGPAPIDRQPPPPESAVTEVDQQLTYLGNSIDMLGNAYMAMRARLDSSVLHAIAETKDDCAAVPVESRSRVGSAIEQHRERVRGLANLINADYDRLAV